MKRLTASEARKNWFRVLDKVAAGEGVVLERKGQWLVLRREDKKVTKSKQQFPDYTRFLRVPDADQADRWSWEMRLTPCSPARTQARTPYRSASA